MTIISAIPVGAIDIYAQLLAGFQEEFGVDDTHALADRIIASELADFLWEARVAERYLGQYVGQEFAIDRPQEELARMSIIGFLAGQWHVGVCLIDGDGSPTGLLWNRAFDDGGEAETAFDMAR